MIRGQLALALTLASAASGTLAQADDQGAAQVGMRYCQEIAPGVAMDRAADAASMA